MMSKFLKSVYNFLRIEFWWTVHNVVVHPLTVLFHWLNLDMVGSTLHDWTVPEGSEPWNLDLPGKTQIKEFDKAIKSLQWSKPSVYTDPFEFADENEYYDDDEYFIGDPLPPKSSGNKRLKKEDLYLSVDKSNGKSKKTSNKSGSSPALQGRVEPKNGGSKKTPGRSPKSKRTKY